MPEPAGARRSREPTARCAECLRFDWSRAGYTVGRPCGMPDGYGNRCQGVMRACTDADLRLFRKELEV